jgi:EAL domain-containing protein (putative c-di-GMP-specific phosphodiesterase class I)
MEVTESTTMSNDLDAIEILRKLKKLGFYISMDDFGTGYSSLSYLKQLPIDKLKIDKSFIDDVPQDEEDIIMVKTIISLAKNLNLEIIAEGVESIEQKEFLLENGCNEIQGYLYSKPLPIDDITAMFKLKV